MDEKSERGNHGGASLEEGSCRRNQGGEISRRDPSRRYTRKGHRGGIEEEPSQGSVIKDESKNYGGMKQGQSGRHVHDFWRSGRMHHGGKCTEEKSWIRNDSGESKRNQPGGTH